MKNMATKKTGANMSKFILFWDCYGLESCIDITEDVERGNDFEKESLFERIKNPDKVPQNEPVTKLNRMVHMLQLRAQFNPQRNYELYMINTTKGITDKDIFQWFSDDPQAAVDRCREIGTKLYSNRATDADRRVII